jgi:sugar O-acyltransferase (sialic acid O-acetyltransferase NeuD family)
MLVAIYGAGGHGKVVWDILTANGHQIVGFVDDSPAAPTLLGVPIVNQLTELPPIDGVILAIGNNRIRQGRFETLRAAGVPFVNAVHPSAILSSRVTVGVGVVIAAGVIVNIDTRIGDNVILNTGATVDHDSEVGDHAHIAPGTHLGGNVRVAEGAFLGLGTRAIPGIRVGEWATCGAGSVLIRDVEPGLTVVGVPARPLIRP